VHEFPTLPIVRCCTTLKNTTAYTFLQKLVNKSAMHAGNFIVVTKQEILVMSLTDVFDAASRRNNDVILLPAIRRVSGNDFVPAGQCTSTLCHTRATAASSQRKTFLHPTFGLQTAQFSVLWTTRSGLSCSIVFATDKSIVWMH